MLEIIGVPCNQHGLQEPGRNEELLNCIKYVRPGNGYVPNFPLTVKDEVNGENEHPLYTFLKSRCPAVKDVIGTTERLYWTPMKNGDITWNFNKFLVGPDGMPYKRYDSSVEPLDLVHDVKEILKSVIPVGFN